MTISQKIKMALAYKGMSEAELARAVGSSPSAFNQRMKTGNFRLRKWRKSLMRWEQHITMVLNLKEM